MCKHETLMRRTRPTEQRNDLVERFDDALVVFRVFAPQQVELLGRQVITSDWSQHGKQGEATEQIDERVVRAPRMY